MSRTYFVVDNTNSLTEGMTKEQIYDAIAEATGATPTPVDEAFITKIKEQNAEHNIKIWKGTQAQYNALATKDNDTIYIIDTNLVKDFSGQIEELAENINSTNARLTGVQTKSLLWTNNEPTKKMGIKEISLPTLSSYQFVEVFANDYLIDQKYSTSIVIEVGRNGVLNQVFPSPEDGKINATTRGVEVFEDRIKFGFGTTSYPNGHNRSDIAIIPWRVYGIKEA